MPPTSSSPAPLASSIRMASNASKRFAGIGAATFWPPAPKLHRRVLFFVIIFAITVGDVLWWIWAHRAARRLARPRVWRPMIAAFSIAQLGYIIFVVFAPVMARRTHIWTPMPIVVAIYLWHLLIMPGTLI